MPMRPPALSAEPLPAPEQLRVQERAENFPVALGVLPRAVGRDLRAVYDVVRTIDDLGDEFPGDRLAALDAFAADLATVWSTGRPRAAVLARLVPTVRRHDLPQEPFDRLVRANVVDQQVHRYERFADLLAYCALSAAPIGELVLRLFGRPRPEQLARSAQVCAGLQVVEHLQDVAEDRRNGRVYLPQQDLAAHGVPESDLDAATASPALRRLLAAEVDRVTALLAAGPPLLASLPGWPRLAVAGYLAGGAAAVDGLRRIDHDVLGARPGTRRRDVVRHLLGALLAARTAAPC